MNGKVTKVISDYPQTGNLFAVFQAASKDVSLSTIVRVSLNDQAVIFQPKEGDKVSFEVDVDNKDFPNGITFKRGKQSFTVPFR